MRNKDLSRYIRQSLHKLQENACAICEDADAFLEVDHIVPVSKGGDDSLRNLQLLCQPCNNLKAGYTAEELDVLGHTAVAARLHEILDERAKWVDSEIIKQLAAPPPIFDKPSYERYRMLTNFQHEFGRALTERMMELGVSESGLRRQLADITGNCFGKNIGRWRRNQYPSPKF